MRWLDDSALERLREAADAPELDGTRYRLIDKLGQGGMGGVFRVEDRTLDREVALKVVTIADAEGVLASRLLQEARVIAKLEHPGIVPVHDAGTLPDGRPYYTMKLVQGKRLEDYVRDVHSISDRLRLFLRICDTVAFAHAHGVLHRDLNPGNVMVGPFGEVLVMDWGLSKILRSAAVKGALPAEKTRESVLSPNKGTAHGAVLGTPGYISPEQMRGDTALDERADIYSLGATLQFLLADTTPSIPRPLAAISTRAVAEEPESRYPSVREMSTDIAHFLDGLAVSAYPEGFAAKAWRWIARNRTWLLLLLAYLVTRGVLIVFRPR